jgi:hypothetical protein
VYGAEVDGGSTTDDVYFPSQQVVKAMSGA